MVPHIPVSFDLPSQVNCSRVNVIEACRYRGLDPNLKFDDGDEIPFPLAVKSLFYLFNPFIIITYVIVGVFLSLLQAAVAAY